MLQILAWVVCLASFICFIMVLIKQFREGGVLHGIIGIITCGLWTLIWGWMNATRLGIKNLMLIWTLLYLGAWILSFMAGALSFSFGTPM